MCVFCVAIFISISRVTDNKHHVGDLVGGAAMGVVVAIFMVSDFRLFFYRYGCFFAYQNLPFIVYYSQRFF